MYHQRSIERMGKQRLIIVSLTASVLIAGCVHVGMRLLRMEVYLDEQLILRTMFAVPDNKGPSYFWQRAGSEPFASDEEVVQVQPNEGNPLGATISGLVQIRIVHVDRVMTSASLTSLTLVRNTRESGKWYLPKQEVQRIKQAAGL